MAQVWQCLCRSIPQSGCSAAASSTEDGLPASTHPFHAWSRQWSCVCKSGRGESNVRVNSSLGAWRRVIYGISDPGQALLAWP